MRKRTRGKRRAPRDVALGRRLGGLTTLVGLAVLFNGLFGLPLAFGSHGPVIVPGNAECGVGELSFKDDDGPMSPASNDALSITYSDMTHVSVLAGGGFVIDAVIIKAGPNSAIYTDPPWTNLESIVNPAGELAAISHVTVCYSTAGTTSSSITDTTDTRPSSSSEPSTTSTDASTTSTDEVTTTSAGSTTSSSVAPSSSSTSTTTTQPSTTTEGTTSTSEATTTTTATTSPTSDASPAVSVLPTELDQTTLPQTGLDDIPTAVIGALLILAGSGVLVAVERRERARRRAPLTRI